MAGIYIHIPFCKQACSYCNFHFSTQHLLIPQLVKSIAKEMEIKKDYLAETIDTIYFGGGTPSILSINDVEFLLQELAKYFVVNAQAEITLEANPDDITEDKLQAWKTIGINRLSLGIQSFVDEDLQLMNRSHNAVQAQQCIGLIKKYFSNYSIDLIYGSQLLSNKQWLQNIETALSFNPPHISCYALTIEEKTKLNYQVRKKILPPINNNKQAQQFNLLMKTLHSKGYNHYEISNYALPNFESKHNSSYWQGKYYLGLGPSAHSYNGNTRSWNIANNALYIKAIEQNDSFAETENLTVTQQLNEYIMIALRTAQGINMNKVEQQFGITIAKQLQQNSLAFISDKKMLLQQEHLLLTNKGKLFADGIASELFF